LLNHFSLGIGQISLEQFTAMQMSFRTDLISLKLSSIVAIANANVVQSWP
jgi:hypothetical protein